MGILPKLIVPDDTPPLCKGAISLWGPLDKRDVLKEKVIAEALAKHLGFDIETPWKDLTPEQQHAILYGTGDDILTITTPGKGGHKNANDDGNIVPIFTASFQMKSRSITLKMTMKPMKTPSPTILSKCPAGHVKAPDLIRG